MAGIEGWLGKTLRLCLSACEAAPGKAAPGPGDIRGIPRLSGPQDRAALLASLDRGRFRLKKRRPEAGMEEQCAQHPRTRRADI